MAADPADDVAAPVHHIDHFFVAGCATFPTSSHANPTLTIVALALRLADHLATTQARA